MRYAEFYKLVDNIELVVAGMFTRAEIKTLRSEGYRERQVNKNGIPLAA